MVRSAVYDAESADENKTALLKAPGVARRAGTTARLKSLVRSFPESRMEQWRSKRQGSAYVGGNRINSGIPSG